MKNPEYPTNPREASPEVRRLEALQRYEVLDTPAELAFDDITTLASQICDCPISLISLIDSNRQWFKSRVGLDVPETSRDIAFCDHAIRNRGLTIVPDATSDPRFKNNPLVTADPGIRFYAGAPLTTDDGFSLGTLCVIDRSPRQLSESQQGALTALARQVMAQLKLRQLLAESRHATAESDRNGALVAGQRKVLEMIVRGQPLDRVLGELAAVIEAHSRDGVLVSILLTDLEQGCLRLGAAPSLPPEYNRAVDGAPIAPVGGSCTAAAYSGRTIIASDIATDPVWEPYRALALSHGLRACWSIPVTGMNDTIVGTFAMYYREPRSPTQDDLNLAHLVSRTAALAIEHSRTVAERGELLSRERQARADAEQANREKDEFIGIVSHELRTPLNSILGWAHLLRTEALDQETVRRGLETIDRNAKAQARLVDDLLDVARIISGKLSLATRELELAPLVNAAIEAVQLSASKNGVQLHNRVTSDRARVKGDADRIQQIMVNLLSNAIKFTPTGGSVEIATEVHDTAVELRVTDTGCGIEPEFIPHLFSRFSQAHGSSTRRHGGLGLGLAIVEHLTKLHRADVAVHSEGAGCGTTFTVTFPLITPSSDDAHVRRGRDAAPESASRTSAGLDRTPLRGSRIVAVDDDMDSRTLLMSVLRRAGAEVISLPSAADAMAYLRNSVADALISDIEMPEQDGYSLIRSIRRLTADQGGRIPAVALTAHAAPADRNQALAAGFDAHLAKPVDVDRIVQTLCQLIECAHREI